MSAGILPRVRRPVWARRSSSWSAKRWERNSLPLSQRTRSSRQPARLRSDATRRASAEVCSAEGWAADPQAVPLGRDASGHRTSSGARRRPGTLPRRSSSLRSRTAAGESRTARHHPSRGSRPFPRPPRQEKREPHLGRRRYLTSAPSVGRTRGQSALGPALPADTASSWPVRFERLLGPPLQDGRHAEPGVRYLPRAPERRSTCGCDPCNRPAGRRAICA